MNIGKACGVFEQIKSDKYTDQEKLYAIKHVIDMPTHNGITKAAIIDAFIWFYNWAAEESNKKQTNADRIRSMTDEELDGFLRKVKADYQWSDPEFPDVDDDWTEWLQSEMEE